ncbi:MAG: DivIVA domain-containing protein [Microbacteriaceae bacterium]|nr:DivIVA domain-containing protein [Microbacteriaceae bacterium]
MALTPEDVVNKRFQSTKFKEGYDQDEVDDFLDEVVVELRRLNQENDELRKRVAASEAQVAELQRNAGSAQAAPQFVPQTAPAQEPAASTQFSASDPMGDPNSTNNLLQLARRLHEEHVREGAEKRDALIAEGHATAARIVSEAEAAQRAQISNLEQERVSIERRIEDLRQFEREYRAKLKGHLEGILHELDATSTQGQSAPAQPFQSAPAQPQGF